MPIKFLCEHCNAKLQVASRKAGSEQTCPRCKKVMRIPDAEIAEAMLAMKSSDRFSEAVGQEDDFLEFTVFDDEELVYDKTAERANSHRLAKIDPQRVSVPRMALYIQGALLGVIACVFFVFGVMVGKFTTTPDFASAQNTMRCRVIGHVNVRSNNQTRPDVGAMVILVPKDRRPDPRPDVDQLRPGVAVDSSNSDQQLLREIGGDVATVSQSGEFELSVTSPRDYYLLVISKNRRHNDSSAISKEERASMGQYFLPVEQLIADREFEWKEVRLTGSSYEVDTITF